MGTDKRFRIEVERIVRAAVTIKDQDKQRSFVERELEDLDDLPGSVSVAVNPTDQPKNTLDLIMLAVKRWEGRE